MSRPAFVTRFAPSPTGLLHLGHAFSALTAFDAARMADGEMLLRIEDIDATRCRAEFETAIVRDLAWLGAEWPLPVRRQSDHLAAYRDALGRLRARGLIYRCFRTRREVMEDIGRAPDAVIAAFAGGPAPLAEEERLVAAGAPFAWRLSLTAARAALGGRFALTFVEQGAGPAGESGEIAARPELAGDVVLARKDLGVAYHLAVVVDDALQGVSHVIRGADLFAAAHIQRLLQALLDLPTPVYRHHPLILRPDGRRFAKRDTTETLGDLRRQGVTPPMLRERLGLI
ncbi:MAG TPA: tRNA glutamyl-Q(34) synthetase GluQRS [Caulobacteraceae bacterium]|nr:tRNA glutamyl-Q(34) synthetase GluQRS [Caulobacteraceae bacterium]